MSNQGQFLTPPNCPSSQKIKHKQKLATAHVGKPRFTLKQYIYEIIQEFILMFYNLADNSLHLNPQLAIHEASVR